MLSRTPRRLAAAQEDSRGTGSLTRTMFNDGLFELADMWYIPV